MQEQRERQRLSIIICNDEQTLPTESDKIIEMQKRQSLVMQTIGESTVRIAHQLRSQLVVIDMNLKMAANQASEQRKEEYLTEAEEICQQLHRLCRRILEFGRLSLPEPQPIDINDSIAKVIKWGLIDRCFELGLDLDETTKIMIDPIDLQQVIMCLILNAREAIWDAAESENPNSIWEVGISVKEFVISDTKKYSLQGIHPGNYVRMSISDNGCGIDPENFNKIFVPYFTTKEEGTGIGLHIVRTIVVKYGGFIKVLSRIGCGSMFEIFFPAICYQ